VYLWVEGVEFDRTIYDTEDIATIRGSSMYLEGLAGDLDAALKPLGAGLHDFGASRAVFALSDADQPRIAAAVQAFRRSDPWQHFCLIHGFGATVTAARAKARLDQLRDWSLPLSGPVTAKGPDALDGLRPATELDRRPEDKDRHLSPSVMTRRKNGLKNRPNGFVAPLTPPPSFADIVDLWDTPARMPEVVRGKLAVVVADGIGMSAIRKTYGDGSAFAQAVQDFRNRLTKAIADWVQSPEHRDTLIGHRKKKGEDVSFPRLDVLVWGGDDMTFVLPASHLLPFLALLIGQCNQPFAKDKAPLPHRIGCVIANHKVPIRQMRGMASDAERLLRAAKGLKKTEGQSLFSIDIFESAALPFDSLSSVRSDLYGAGNHALEHAFTGAELASLRQFLTETIGDGTGCLATSKLHDVLQQAWGPNRKKALTQAGPEITQRLTDHFDARDERNPSADWTKGYAAPKLLPVFLAQAAQLLPYAQVRA
jgi:hypothetical protein